MVVKKFRVVIVEANQITDARKLFDFEKEYDSEEDAFNAVQATLNEYVPESYTFGIIPIYYKKYSND